ncbi:hypothetical protein [Desulfatiglans anilini]|uniref:hypothetical protein n=1 Tax=Desulfatiglans anilini TaxID=90728 RepID=UPI001294869B|nr:hypothetical protein [Desulfatiglans anilini]
MGEKQKTIEGLYKDAKHGNWEQVLSDWRRDPQLAQQCSRYQKPSSGWTFLHQAAYFGHEAACLELIRLGVRWSVGMVPSTRRVEWLANRWFDRVEN